MANILEFKESMTVYYSLSTGVIRQVMGGVQDMSLYGDLQSDMELIQGYLVVPREQRVLDNSKLYKVDVEKKMLLKIMSTEEEEQMQAIKAENDERFSLIEDAVNELILGGMV